MVETKIILLIGRTGRGKSTLANVITNTTNFKESSGSISETKEIQTGEFENNNLSYLIIDTPGIGDTQMSTEKVLDTIAEAVFLVRDGASRVFFVTNGRFEQYEMATYDLLRIVIFDKNITDHTTIVRTHFEDFRKSKKCKEDVDEMIKGGGDLSEIIESCQREVVHINNPVTTIALIGSGNKEREQEREEEIKSNQRARDKSREKLLDNLNKKCNESPYKSSKLENLNAEIVGYMKNKKSLEGELVLKERLKKKRIRRLGVKIIDDSRSKKKENLSAEDTNKSKSVTKRGEQTNNQDHTTNQKNVENKIKKLENEKERLKKQLQEKEKIIRKKVREHILSNYNEIVNIKGGHIFISSINDENWEELIKDKNKRLVSEWFKELEQQQQIKLINILESYFGSDYIPFCVWLKINKELTSEKALNNDIKQLREEYFLQLEKEKTELKAKLNLRKRQERQLQNIVQHIQEDLKNLTGQEVIKKFIQNYQSNVTSSYEGLEWIPYEQFVDIEYLAEGGFSKIYKAKWVDGPIKNWGEKNDRWKRKSNKIVVLKFLINSQNITLEFLTEIANTKLVDNSGSVAKHYGISQDPITKNYVMVMEHINGGNLRQYLQNKYNGLSLEDKLYQLYTIIFGLDVIHNQDLIHRDFHSGNILVDDVECYITDLGLSQSVNYQKQEGVIYGVLPYVAPEVLRGQPYTQSSDIYSFSIIAYELLAHSYPYCEYEHDDVGLAVKIIGDGLRPNIDEIPIPQELKDLIKRCWDVNSKKRPSSYQLNEILHDWYNETDEESSREEYSTFRQQYQLIKDEYNTFSQNTPYKIHPTTIVASKMIDTKQISKLLSSRMSSIDFIQTYNEYQTMELDFNIETSTSTQELNKRIRSLSLEVANQQANNKSVKLDKIIVEKQEFQTEPMEVNNYNWQNLHPDFNFELIQNWQNQGFSPSQTQDYLSIGLQPSDHHFAAFLRDQKHLTPEEVLNHGNLEQLNQEFSTWQTQQFHRQEQPPK